MSRKHNGDIDWMLKGGGGAGVGLGILLTITFNCSLQFSHPAEVLQASTKLLITRIPSAFYRVELNNLYCILSIFICSLIGLCCH
jgi:hypothetical protein